MRGATEAIGQVRIADVSGQHHAADAQGDERRRTLARLRLVQVVLEDLDQLLHDLLVGGLDRLTAALKPSYLMWLEWTDGRISFIRDYRYVR